MFNGVVYLMVLVSVSFSHLILYGHVCIPDVLVHCSIFSSVHMRSVLSVSAKVSVRVYDTEWSIF